MHGFEEFGDIVKTQEPLAPYTSFKVGGPAELLVQPRSVPELTAVVTYVASLNGVANLPGSSANASVRTAVSEDAARGRDLFSDAVRGFGRCFRMPPAGA